MHVAQRDAFTWTEIDDAITRLASAKGELDLELGRWLLVAQREGVERPLGFGSFAEYAARRLGFDARTTYERLRVARALETLPALASLLRTGERSWSAVRELTRVAKPETEAAWIEASERKTVRQIEADVARRQPGDDPRDPPAPLLAMHRLVFELPPDELAEWREAAEAVRREVGPAATNREVLRAMAQRVLGPRPEAQPGYQTAVTLCAGCERTWQRAGSELIEVAPEVGACARCDGGVVGVVEIEDPTGAAGEHVGMEAGMSAHVGTRRRDGGTTAHVDVLGRSGGPSAHVGTDDTRAAPGTDSRATAHVGTPTDEPHIADLLARLVRLRGSRVLTRVLSRIVGAPPKTITPKLRNAVRARDRGRCVVPGCQNFRFVDVHHHQHRAAGGPNTLENLYTLCTQHHRRVHEGVLDIERRSDGGLVVRHAGGVLYGAVRRAVEP